MQQKASNLIARAKIMANIRQWFEKNRFIEVETPILVDCPDLSPNFNILETKISPPVADCLKSVIPSGVPSFANDRTESRRSRTTGRSRGIPLMREKHILAKEIPPLPLASPVPQYCGTGSLGVGRDDKTSFLDSLSVKGDRGCRSASASIKYLITSPEFSMKKLLALDGLDSIYTITKVFRDGEEDTGIHSIEFTMLEWYRKNADYKDIMRDTEELVKHVLIMQEKKRLPAGQPPSPPFSKGVAPLSGAGGFFDGTTCSTSPYYQTRSKFTQRALTDKSNFHLPASEKSPPPPLWKRGELNSFPRLKISNLFKKYAHIDNVEKLTLPVFKKIVHSREYSKDKNLNYEQCFNLIFLNEIEPKLPKTPFFLIDYPTPLAALAKLKKGNPYIAERFELYINGIELCNGFSELTDGKEQLARFKQENRERKRLGKPELPIDYELCEKLNLIGKAGGNALGIDRLVMILLGAKKIEEVLY